MTVRKYIILAVVASAVLLSCSLIGCGGKQSLSNLTAREIFDLAKAKYDAGKYFRATEIFQSLIFDYPGETLIDTAQFYLAMSYYANKDYILGRVEFNRLVNYYPASVFMPQSVFMKAVCLYEGAPRSSGLDQTQVKESVGEFEDFLIDFPESEFVPDCQAYLEHARTRLAKKDFDAAMVYYRMHAYKAAEIYFQKVIDEYTTTTVAGSSLYYIGDMNLKDHKYDDAVRALDSFIRLHPDHELIPKAKEKLPEAAFRAAKVYVDIENYPSARSALEKFLTDYPDSEQAEDARKILSEIPAVSADSTASTDQDKKDS